MSDTHKNLLNEITWDTSTIRAQQQQRVKDEHADIAWNRFKANMLALENVLGVNRDKEAAIGGSK